MHRTARKYKNAGVHIETRACSEPATEKLASAPWRTPMKHETNSLKTLNQSPQLGNWSPRKIADGPRVSVLQIIAVLCLSLIPLGCSRVPDFIKDTFQPEVIVPVFDPDAYIMPQTGTVGYLRNGIKAMAVPLNDVKAVDAFGIFIL